MTDYSDELQAATILARQHRSQVFLLWTADDWNRIIGVSCVRRTPETVRLTLRDLGRGTMSV